MIGDSCFSEQGESLWGMGSKKTDNDEGKLETIVVRPQFELFMRHHHFRQWKEFCHVSWENEDEKGTDEWCQVSSLFSMFDRRRRAATVPSLALVLHEPMSAFQPRTAKLSMPPNARHMQRKLEPLGTEFKNVACSVLGTMTCVEVQRGKETMRLQKCNKECGATAGCVL